MGIFCQKYCRKTIYVVYYYKYTKDLRGLLMSVLLCDSNGELWFTRAQELGIKYISMPYTLQNKEYHYDLGEKIDIHEFYKQVRHGHIPITSALNPHLYCEIIEPIFQRGEDVIYVSFSHALSGTFGHLNTALAELSERYPERKCTIFNTNSISLGAGIQMEQAAIMHNNGATDQEIIEFLQTFTHQVAVYFMVDDLMHLKRGGRLTGMQAAMGSIMGIKPIITMNAQGGLQSLKKINGKRKALNELADKCIADLVDADKYTVYIVDADSPHDGDYVRDRVLASRPEAQIFRQIVGPVIGSHCGPGTIGIIFVANSRPVQLEAK